MLDLLLSNAAMFMFIGAAVSAVVPSAAPSAVIAAPIVPTFTPRSDDLCSSRGNSTAPEPSSSSLSSFVEDDKYNSLALSAPVPTGYALAMSNANCAFSSTKYMLYVQLDSYSPDKCAELCNKHEGCDSFNIYIQRDPSVIPGPACPNPAAIFVTKCALYSEPEQLSSCTNFGQHVGPVDADGEAFKVALRSSNAYKKVNPVRKVFVTVTTTETIFAGQKDRRTLIGGLASAEYDATTTVKIPKPTLDYVGSEAVVAPAGTVTVTSYHRYYNATTTTTIPGPAVNIVSKSPDTTTTTTITHPASIVTLTSIGADAISTVYGKRDIVNPQFAGKKEGEARWNAWDKTWIPAPHCCDSTTIVTVYGTPRPGHVLPSYYPRDVSKHGTAFVIPTGLSTVTAAIARPTETITTTYVVEVLEPITAEAGTFTEGAIFKTRLSLPPTATESGVHSIVKYPQPEASTTLTLDDSRSTGTNLPIFTFTQE